MKLSVVIPAHNEEGSIGRDGRGHRARAARRRDRPTRSSWSTTTRRDGTAAIVAALAETTRRALRRARTTRTASGFAVRAGLERFTGDAVAIVMADALRPPARPRRLLPAARGGLRLRVRLALHAGRGSIDYPRLKLVDQPARQPGHPPALRPRLQRHDERVQGATAARSSRRPAAAVQPLQPHRRAPAEGRRPRPLLRDHPDRRGRTARPASPSCDLQEMGSRYLFIVLYVVPRAPPQPRRLPSRRRASSLRRAFADGASAPAKDGLDDADAAPDRSGRQQCQRPESAPPPAGRVPVPESPPSSDPASSSPAFACLALLSAVWLLREGRGSDVLLRRVELPLLGRPRTACMGCSIPTTATCRSLPVRDLQAHVRDRRRRAVTWAYRVLAVAVSRALRRARVRAPRGRAAGNALALAAATVLLLLARAALAGRAVAVRDLLHGARSRPAWAHCWRSRPGHAPRRRRRVRLLVFVALASSGSALRSRRACSSSSSCTPPRAAQAARVGGDRCPRSAVYGLWYMIVLPEGEGSPAEQPRRGAVGYVADAAAGAVGAVAGLGLEWGRVLLAVGHRAWRSCAGPAKSAAVARGPGRARGADQRCRCCSGA